MAGPTLAGPGGRPGLVMWLISIAVAVILDVLLWTHVVAAVAAVFTVASVVVVAVNYRLFVQGRGLGR